MKLFESCSNFGGIKFDTIPVRVIEINHKGNSEEKYVTIESLAKDVRNEERLSFSNGDGKRLSLNSVRNRMPIRDLKLFSPFDTINVLQDPDDQVKKLFEGPKHPSIMPRPSAKCFILELEHIKLLCKSDRCIIFHPEQNAEVLQIDNINVPRCFVTFIETFVLNLKQHLTQENTKFQTSFEIAVLEVVFSNVVSKLMKHLTVMKPVLELLMHEIQSSNPPTQDMLRKLLALKQNMNKFEKDVESIKDVVQNVLSSDQDMADLKVTFLDQAEQMDLADHEDVELLLEAFNEYLNHIGFELKRMNADVGDVEDFVTIHLSSTRNKILRLSLFMEMGMLSVAFGAMIAGIWGMNLGFGDENWSVGKNRVGFYVVMGVILLLTFILTWSGFIYYKKLYANTTQAQRSNFYALKNYTLVIDEVKARLNYNVDTNGNQTMSKIKLDTILRDVVNAQPDEEDLIRKSVLLDGLTLTAATPDDRPKSPA